MTLTMETSSPRSGRSIQGSTTPRLFTPPLVTGPAGPCGCGCALTPGTSFGFAVEAFAQRIGRELDPWERWTAIHGGELLPNGRPRFRQLLVIVARQNGKTELLVILTLFWLFVERVALILGTSTNLDYARESWDKAVQLVEDTPRLDQEKAGVRRTNGEQTLTTVHRCRYKIAASNRKGGRSLTVHRLVMDELREHQSWEAWNAAVPATNAVPDAQVWALSNMGDARAAVLLSLRRSALRFINTGEGDDRLGIFEWSAPPGSSPVDPGALAQANPNVGIRLDMDDLLAAGRRAVENGGEELAGFKTEMMCVYTPMMDPAIDQDQWKACADLGSLDGVKDRAMMALDVSLDGLHATLYAAALLDDGRVRVDAVKDWSGPDEMRHIRRDLDDDIRRIRPQALGWFPSGPAASIAGELADPPAGVAVEAIKGDVTAVCMGFEKLVSSRQLIHSSDPLLDAHVAAAERVHQGDAWRFGRRGTGQVDAVYAAAGAAHLARMVQVEPPLPQPMVV